MIRIRHRLAAILTGLSLLAVCQRPGVVLCTEQAQASSAATAATFAGYDVISVKRSKPGGSGWSINSNDTTFEAKNVAIQSLLMNAYGIREALIFGLPKWAESSRWDISAKVLEATAEAKEDHLTREQSEQRYRAKLQSILQERFQVKTHVETKVMPVYELVLLPGPLHLETASGDGKHGSMNVRNRELTATGIPMEAITRFLSDQVGRNVIDRAGLTGLYSMTLKWSPDELAEAAEKSDTNDRPPAIYQALQEQLGLKLVPSKGPSDTLVVDSIQEPLPD